MLTKRIIPCLDVREGKVVKGVQFRDHVIVGEIEFYAEYYRDAGADELVFYDITASSEGRTIDCQWITKVAKILDIPFCVAGGIRTVRDARAILQAGAEKISINSPAIENPALITALAQEFGSQCVVVGIDSFKEKEIYDVYQYTGNLQKTQRTSLHLLDWVQQVQERGAGEIVLNCMNQDGVKQGYDIQQLSMIRKKVSVPLIASGGAGLMEHFYEVFQKADVDGALAAMVFHNQDIQIPELKRFLKFNKIEVRV